MKGIKTQKDFSCDQRAKTLHKFGAEQSTYFFTKF